MKEAHGNLRFFVIYWYLGVIHELAHVMAAACYSHLQLSVSWWDIFLDRTAKIVFPEDLLPSPFYDSAIRHFGWIFSFVLAISLVVARHNSTSSRPPLSKSTLSALLYDDDVIFLACLVALEALATDLFLFPTSSTQRTTSFSYYCGNFGILLINDIWFQDPQHRTKVLDVLQHMCQVTMVRGAQSGGVVCYHQGTATRVRVVNRKRTDLSLQLLQQINRKIPSLPRAYIGHTRFATSSKATLGGTHPHQWTPASEWRCWDGTGFGPRRVENFITHNGDFDFLLSGSSQQSSLSTIREWLQSVTGTPTPDPVDSCAVAGVIDVFRTATSFGLSARYACASPKIAKLRDFPPKSAWEAVGLVFEREFVQFCGGSSNESGGKNQALEQLMELAVIRQSLATKVADCLLGEDSACLPASVIDVTQFARDTIDAFLDNSLMGATSNFLDRAKGSFGIAVSSSLDADSRICLAARGQTISVAFFRDFVLYGSEQAAVKAGLEMPPIDSSSTMDPVVRLDLDDLGGEVVCLDWSNDSDVFSRPPVDHVQRHRLLDGKLNVYLYQQTLRQPANLKRRLTQLTGNSMIQRLPPKTMKDPILSDLRDIPRVLRAIQSDWAVETSGVSSNRLAAFTLGRALRTKLKALDGNHHQDCNRVDILVTGCEVSLWVGEQFASDLQKALPRLRICAMSTNKLLGLYGQAISVPAVGFPASPTTLDLHDAIIIIVSQSGGTFSPLLCSKLLQSTTDHLFVVTSEYDTQIGRQLRALDDATKSGSVLDNISTRIFSTGVGLRPSEPASLTVAATHQLLTNLFEYICILMIEHPLYRRISGAVVTEEDIRILEKCNTENIDALEEIVGRDSYGYPKRKDGHLTRTENELRKLGNLWACHVLENTKAYIMTIFYVLVTVTSGWPVATAIARGAGLPVDHSASYLISFVDAIIFIALPQINTLVLRVVERRNLRHRMVGRTVAIADIPWVAQCADAFASKLFACSYSIAGLNVLNANPADHFVHRLTHRVVRGTLLIAGRPDGRLSALTTKESAVCLSVTQASSIQSWGGTCESITIGHNPSELPLSLQGIFLGRKRPLFLCERLLIEADNDNDGESDDEKRTLSQRLLRGMQQKSGSSKAIQDLDQSFTLNCSVQGLAQQKNRYAASILGHYTNFAEQAPAAEGDTRSETEASTSSVLQSLISVRKASESAQKLFVACDQVRFSRPIFHYDILLLVTNLLLFFRRTKTAF